MPSTEITPETTVGVTVLAQMFGMTAMRIQQLATDGVIIRHGRGEYRLMPSVSNFLAYQLNKPKNQHDSPTDDSGERGGIDAHKLRLTKAKADIAEIDADLRKGNVHDAATIAAVWGDMIGNARAKLLGIPVKLAGALDGLELAEREAVLREHIQEALRELAEYRPSLLTGEYDKARRMNEEEEEEDEEEESDVEE